MAVTGRFGARFVTVSMVAGDRRSRLLEIEGRVRCRESACCRCLAENGETEDWRGCGSAGGPAPQTKLGSWEAEASLVGAGINLSVGTVCHELRGAAGHSYSKTEKAGSGGYCEPPLPAEDRMGHNPSRRRYSAD